MSIINLSEDDYYSQRNNKIKPGVACMPTSRVMFYLGNKFEILNDSEYAHDDYFMNLLNTTEAYQFCHKKYPWAKGKYPPNEVHGMYCSWLDEKVIGERMSNFVEDLTWRDYLTKIAMGQVIMTSGSFPEAGIDGHAFCIIGQEDDNKLMLADPYGKYPDYKSDNGYGTTMSKDDFIKYIFPCGSLKKWGHILL